MVLYSRCAQLRWNFLVPYLEWRFLAYAWNEPSWFRTWNRGSLACFISCSLCLACYVAIEATWYKFIDDNRIFSFFFFFKVDTKFKIFFFRVLSLLNPSVQFSSVAQLCPTLCDPMNRSTPGLPIHHQLPEFTQTHVYWASDAIQPSHSLSSPSPPAPNPSQHQSLFQQVNSSHEVAKVLEFQL